MTNIELTDGALEPIPLAPRVTLGPGEVAPAEQLDRISLGRPACVPLDPTSVDADAKVFLASKPGSAYWLLAVICSFRAIEDEPMESAWLEIKLQTIRPGGGPVPTAWSMEPLTLQDPMQISRVAKLDASLKLTSEVIPVEVGPSWGKEVTSSYSKRLPYVEAHREGTARPSWIFSRTPVTEIRGVHRLRTVVELPGGATGKGEISVGATVKLKRLRVISYRARLEQLPDQRTVVFG
jgi:hypothetical protein